MSHSCSLKKRYRTRQERPARMNTVDNNHRYSLEPDVPGSDAALVDFFDLRSSDYELSHGACCEGQWNMSHPRGPKWWQHIKRPRYQAIDLSKFF